MAELRSLKRRAGIAEETVRIKSDMASLLVDRRPWRDDTITDAGPSVHSPQRHSTCVKTRAGALHCFRPQRE